MRGEISHLSQHSQAQGQKVLVCTYVHVLMCVYAFWSCRPAAPSFPHFTPQWAGKSCICHVGGRRYVTVNVRGEGRPNQDGSLQQNERPGCCRSSLVVPFPFPSSSSSIPKDSICRTKRHCFKDPSPFLGDPRTKDTAKKRYAIADPPFSRRPMHACVEREREPAIRRLKKKRPLSLLPLIQFVSLLPPYLSPSLSRSPSLCVPGTTTWNMI